MKILLVKPYPKLKVAKCLQEGFLHLEPLELEIVAAGVPAQEKVEIIDLSIEKNPVIVFSNKLTEFAPDIVGFGAYSTNMEVVKDLAKLVKKINPKIITMVGGVHATLLPADYKNSFDLIVRGEGATIMPELVRRFKNKEPLFFDNRVLSLVDIDFDKKSLELPPKYPLMESIPRPRRDLVDSSKYFCVWTSSDTGRLDTMFPQTASMRTSLGCAFSCSFCVIHFLMSKKYLIRSPEDVVDEISKLPQSHIYFVDDEMFLDIDRAAKIAKLLLDKNIKKRYVSWARSDTIVKHPEVFKLWKKAGLDTVYVGLESVDESRLKEYSKLISVQTNRKAIAVLKDAGIMLHAAFIVHPDFEVEDFRRLEAEIARISPAEITFTVLSPSPGTDYWRQNKDRFICDPYKFYDCMHSVLPTRLPLRLFYQHFGRLTALALRANPLRAYNIKVPFKDFVRAIVGGTKYIFSLYTIDRDYLKK